MAKVLAENESGNACAWPTILGDLEDEDSQFGKLCPEEPHYTQLKLLDFGRGTRSQRCVSFGV